jgi:hypothetical protein
MCISLVYERYSYYIIFCIIAVREFSLDIVYFEEKSCFLDVKGSEHIPYGL